MFLKSCFIAIFSHYFHGTSVLYCHFLSFSSFIIISYPEIHILNMSPSPISTFPCVSFISLLCSIFCCPCICPVDTNLLYAAPLAFSLEFAASPFTLCSSPYNPANLFHVSDYLLLQTSSSLNVLGLSYTKVHMGFLHRHFTSQRPLFPGRSFKIYFFFFFLPSPFSRWR